MATAAEVIFSDAVAVAEMNRQISKDAARATYAGLPANLATYRTALVAADVAYITAVNSAASTAAITLNSGYSTLLGGRTATIAS